ncbi:ATP-dependent RNA helicase dbp6 [Rhodotorula kratochvilovae]
MPIDQAGNWQPAGEDPAEREKRLKREKRAAALAAAGGGASSSFAPAPAQGARESYGGWQPAEGESPAEREKRLKREKRAALLASSQGGSAAPAAARDAPPHQHPLAQAQRSQREEYDGWRPVDEGETPAEREKRIKREKRAAMLAAQGGAPAPVHAAVFIPPPAELGGESYAPAQYAGEHADAQEDPNAEPKRSKHAQSKTTARMRYLKRKKQTRKAKKAAMPKKKGDAADGAAVAGTKRAREDDEDDSDDSDGESSDDSGGESDAASAAPTPTPVPASTKAEKAAAALKWPELSEAEREAKLALVAQKKAERRDARLAKKAELKRIKAEGGQLPPPKRRVVETTKPRARETAVVKEPTPQPEEEKEPTEEEIAEQKKREEIAARKALKALKKAHRRDSTVVLPAAEEEAKEGDDEPSTRIPTAPPVDGDSAMDIDAPAPASPPAALLRLPSATRPAPPSAKVLSALNVHAQVRDKQVVDPLRKVPVSEEVGADGTGVGERGRKRLRGEMGVEEWFAVQTAVLPLLLPPSATPPALYAPFNPPRDVCVSAPTGSGKTLSYVVPIVETLQHRVVTRLRALVLLPTRDLVGQVRETFEAYMKGTGLKVGVATGQHSFAHEQNVLVGDDVAADCQGGSSQVDILIATPGRLIDHLKATKGFSLQHLRFLVVDEADRLLTQSFHDWLPTVLSALKPSFSAAALAEKENDADPVGGRKERRAKRREGGLREADALAPAWWDAEGKVGRVASDVDERCHGSCQKLLFSATLSRDPAKIDALHLHRPVYISVEDALDPHAEDEGVDSELKFTFPAELSEHMIISPASHKPLCLFHLLHTLSISSALCFTKSVEAASRLAKLVEFFEDARVAAAGEEGAKRVVVKAYSSELAPGERNKVLREFKKGEVQMLICSDLIARGIDIPNVSHVISYDIPADMRKYVHRVGRTARAGNKGDAWSLVEEQEVAPFKAIMSSAQHYAKIGRVKVKDTAIEDFVPPYQAALERLRLFFATGRERERSSVAM